MTNVPRISRRFVIPTLTALLLGATSITNLQAADVQRDADEAPTELFAAMDAGQVEVRFIPHDATKANILVKNLTDKPLNVRIPAAFAGVPILAQGMMGGGMGGMGGGGMGGGGMGGGGGGGGQAMGGGGGGGMGGGMGGGGMGGGGMGGGFMRVAPEKMRKFAVTTVCLEHGKPDPNPRMAYTIVPLEKVTSDSRVRVLCEALGNGQIAQNTAQAAAWHLMDNMTWEELAAKNRVESKYIGTIKWFSPLELRTAFTVVGEVTRIANERKPSSDESNRYESEAVNESAQREALLGKS